MKDLLNNEINIGDKVVYCPAYSESKALDYGIVSKVTDKTCICKSLIRNDSVARRQSNQIIKLG